MRCLSGACVRLAQKTACRLRRRWARSSDLRLVRATRLPATRHALERRWRPACVKSVASSGYRWASCRHICSGSEQTCNAVSCLTAICVRSSGAPPCTCTIIVPPFHHRAAANENVVVLTVDVAGRVAGARVAKACRWARFHVEFTCPVHGRGDVGLWRAAGRGRCAQSLSTHSCSGTENSH